MDWKKTAVIVGLLMTLSGVVGGAIAWEKTIAKRCDLDQLAMRLDQKILSDRMHNLQSRIWMLEDRYGGVGVPIAPPEIKAEYRQLQIELEQTKSKLTKGG